eukprot:7864506-Ditylum_brightwellii.AAC.1
MSENETVRAMILLGSSTRASKEAQVLTPDSDCESVSPVCNERKLDKSFAQRYYEQTPTSKKVLTLLAMTEGLDIMEQREALKLFVKEGVMKTRGIEPKATHCKRELNSHKFEGIEKDWVLEELSKFIDEKETLALKEKERREGLDFSVSKYDVYKMRLYEAVFLDEYHYLFIRHHNILSRQELDAWISGSCDKSFWEVLADKYNNPSCVPMSQ